MITIKSNVKLKFPPSKEGFVKISIEKILNNVDSQSYTLLLKDICYNDDNEEIGANLRNVIYTYEELNELAVVLNERITELDSFVNKINELFKKGLLLKTQMDGNYYSTADDWELWG